MMKNSSYVLMSFVLVLLCIVFNLKINDNAIYMLILACTFWIVKTLEDNKGN